MSNPTWGELDSCRKADVMEIATHFQLSVQKLLKREIKCLVVGKLLEQGTLVLPVVSDKHASSPGEPTEAQPSVSEEHDCIQAHVKGAEKAGGKVTLPPFDLASPVSNGSREGAQVNVRIARLQMEAQEKAQARAAEYQLRRMELEAENERAVNIRRLELEHEVDKELRLRRLELEVLRSESNSATLSTSPPGPGISSSTAYSSHPFDISKHIALVPPFRETEVDTYFNVFERIAASLRWPKEVWPLLLQCKLTGKAQEVCSTLTLEDSLLYDTVKAAILRAYELVPEAYRQRFRNHKRAANQTFVEFAREKGTL